MMFIFRGCALPEPYKMASVSGKRGNVGCCDGFE